MTPRKPSKTEPSNVLPFDGQIAGGFAPEALLGPLNDHEKRHAPQRLFIAGNRELLQRHPRVSLVGARKASPEGIRRASKLAKILADSNVVVVSGLAEGIDTAAHTAAINAGGSTIAVVGTPLDRAYPAQNAKLQAKIAEDHLVVSQFPIGSPIRKANFPMRNRTMALITDASVIVEAGESSGSLSQGWEALRLNRTLFIMNSVLVDKPELQWPYELQRYGAIFLKDASELLDVLPFGDAYTLAFGGA